MTRASLGRFAPPLIAATLVRLSMHLPLWSMTMTAPQYRHGLHLTAYGSGMQGTSAKSTSSITTSGWRSDPRPALEVAMFPLGIGLIVALCLVARSTAGYDDSRFSRRPDYRSASSPTCSGGSTFGHSLNPAQSDAGVYAADSRRVHAGELRDDLMTDRVCFA